MTRTAAIIAGVTVIVGLVIDIVLIELFGLRSEWNVAIATPLGAFCGVIVASRWTRIH
jgi:uncharacterized membrane protein YjjB (DUF3815 family)